MTVIASVAASTQTTEQATDPLNLAARREAAAPGAESTVSSALKNLDTQQSQKTSLWKKFRKAATIGAGVVAVGGVAYLAYRHFKDGNSVGDISGVADNVADAVAQATTAA